MVTLGVYIPTLGRASKLRSVALNLSQSTYNDYRLYWGCEKHDKESITEGKKYGRVVINDGQSIYSDALQTIYEHSKEPFFLWGNDDFFFLPNWDKTAIEMFKQRPEVGVIGVHDGNPDNNRYSSIALVRRTYIEKHSGVVDMPNRVLYPYKHNFVDDELTETAQSRGMWAKCLGPCIEHQHPSFKWLGEFPDDETYRKNIKTFNEDSITFHNRRQLW